MARGIAALALLAALAGPAGAQSITVVSPNGGEIWILGSSRTITWTSSGVSGNVRIHLLKGGSRVLSLTPRGGVENTGSFPWEVPARTSSGSDYRIRIQDRRGRVSDESDGDFYIGLRRVPRGPLERLEAPGEIPSVPLGPMLRGTGLSVERPAGGETYGLGALVPLRWEHTDASCGDRVRIRALREPDGREIPIAESHPSNVGTNHLRWNVPASGVEGGPYRIGLTSRACMARSARFQITANLPEIGLESLAVEDEAGHPLTRELRYIGGRPRPVVVRLGIRWNHFLPAGGVACDNRVRISFGGRALSLSDDRVPLDPRRYRDRVHEKTLRTSLPSGFPLGSTQTLRAELQPSPSECDANYANNAAWQSFLIARAPVQQDLELRVTNLELRRHVDYLGLGWERFEFVMNAIVWNAPGPLEGVLWAARLHRRVESGGWELEGSRGGTTDVPHDRYGGPSPSIGFANLPEGMPPGRYRLEVTLDPDHAFEDGDRSNNTTTTVIDLPEH